ncbi:cytosolic protein [candidate division KSB1 bacterium]|nr:cytosolic protein [candidate division KSB1 bacterium]
MAVECEYLNKNLDFCNCSYPGCDKKGNCCLCVQYHLRSRELPACFFPDDVERTFDRSFSRFIQTYK